MNAVGYAFASLVCAVACGATAHYGVLWAAIPFGWMSLMHLGIALIEGADGGR